MYRCTSSHCNQVGLCSCSLFHSSANNSFSMLFSPSNPNNTHYQYSNEVDDHQHQYYQYPTPSSSSVDCTLSLGTPSTRQSKSNSNNSRNSISKGRSSTSCIWDIFQTKKTIPSPQTTTTLKGSRGGTSTNSGNNNSIPSNISGDSLLARRCANCDTTSTPLWRNGPRGPKSLCNACGIRYKKEERRASNNNAAAAQSSVMDQQYIMSHQYSWPTHQQHTNQKLSSAHLGNEFMFVQEEDDHHRYQRESDSGIPFLSWRLNVPERPGLVHDYTC
ncbi:hypothetical protein MKW98_030472 [Papaver atlanticum]|uniref:GATA-type domain-containing protein n=1 Tax=Papaver atlanticum TaxID=357466 RepID=A0AAD4XDZ6_9MAGN|nr:hypothetical protein MKW98_030472 [Papaver atlanticum]